MRSGCQNCILRVQSNILSKGIFLKKFFFHAFRSVSDKFSAFRQKVICKVVKMHTTCPDEQRGVFFLKKKTYFSSFSDIEQKLSAFWPNKSAGLSKCTLRVQKNISRETSFLKRKTSCCGKCYSC